MYAVVHHTAPGFHNWPQAPARRDYLAARHRHLFHVTVRLQVFHEEREVEYHDLLDHVRDVFPGGELYGSSCETMATRILTAICRRYGSRRHITVSVYEDGEVGAEVEYRPTQRSQSQPPREPRKERPGSPPQGSGSEVA